MFYAISNTIEEEVGMGTKAMTKRLLVCALVLMLLGGFAATASAAPGWYVCSAAWAGCGGNGVYIILHSPHFSITLGASFPVNSIMASGPADTSISNRYLVTALSAISSRRKVFVYVDPLSISVIGGMYVLADDASYYPR